MALIALDEVHILIRKHGYKRHTVGDNWVLYVFPGRSRPEILFYFQKENGIAGLSGSEALFVKQRVEAISAIFESNT